MRISCARPPHILHIHARKALLHAHHRRRSALPVLMPSVGTRMNPVFRVERLDVVLHPLDMVSVALEQLGEHIGSLADQGHAISDALDELLSRS